MPGSVAVEKPAASKTNVNPVRATFLKSLFTKICLRLSALFVTKHNNILTPESQLLINKN
jgi:hypothetical protein